MKDRGKAVADSSSNWLSDYSSFSDLPCKKHPSPSSVGICAYCLKDRLIKLVCSDCGEQRLSSCSCSDISSSYTAAEIGSVGRISFLIENEKEDFIPHSNTKPRSSSEPFIQLKRSSSSCIGVKRSKIWRIGRFFRKRREKDVENISGTNNNGNGFDEKGEMWVFHNVGVSRSRSVGGLRGGFDESSQGGFTASNVKASETNKDVHLETARRSSGGFSGVESVSGGRVSSLMESDTGVIKGAKKGGLMEFDGGLEDSGFIDLKLAFSSESKSDFTNLKSGDFYDTGGSGFRTSKDGDFSGELGNDSFRYLRGDGISSLGSSCRFTVKDKDIKKCKRSLNVWRWIFRHQPNSGRRMSMYSNPERD